MLALQDICLRSCWLPATLCLTLWSCADSSAPGPVDGVANGIAIPLPSSLDLTTLDPGVALAVEGARAAVDRAPQDAGLRLELGMILDANSMHEAARETYLQSTQLAPQQARAHYHGARMLRELGRFELSRESLERVLELAPQYAPAHRRSADWYLQAGEFDAAAAGFTRVCELKPDWPDGALGLAHLALLREETQKAAVLAGEVSTAHPKNTYAQYLLGCALRDLGHAAEAQEAFARAAGGTPRWRDPWVDEVEARLSGYSRIMVEAKACLEQGLFEEACKRLAILHAQTPDDVTVQGMWTAALTKLSRHDEALRMLLAAGARQPEHFRIELNLAIVRWKQGQLELAIEHLQRSIELNPSHGAVYMVQGQVLGEMKDRRGAIEAFETALRLGSAAQRVLPRIGRLQMAQQSWGPAAKTYQRAAKEMPRDASIQAALAGCLIEAGDRAGALAALARARQLDPHQKLLPMIEARMAELKPGKKP
jgi:tetratricopeptide (TPR) repeat protein